MPPAQLSGYVFIDGGPFSWRRSADAGANRRDRDGKRTPDDTPLAGVTLELRDGDDRAIRFSIGDTMPGTYAGNADRPDSRRDRCQWLLPFRWSARPGCMPWSKCSRMACSTTRYAGHDRRLCGESVDSASRVRRFRPPAIKSIIDQFRAAVRHDAIVEIPLDYGQHSQENNFSEVSWQPPPPHTPPPPVRSAATAAAADAAAGVSAAAGSCRSCRRCTRFRGRISPRRRNQFVGRRASTTRGT